MNTKLFVSSISKFLLGILLVGLLIFVPAGRIYFNGLLLMILLFSIMFLVGLYLFFKNPVLLLERLNAKESENDQKLVIRLCGLMFVTGFIVSGLSYRYNFLMLPNFITYIASFIFLLFYILYFIVLIENDYLYRRIKVEEGQKLIDTGLYGIVRHPMYSVSIIMFLMVPLILGSFLSFLVFLIYPFLISIRIKNEEEVLLKELKGYSDYKKRVRYKVIPYIW